MHGVRLSVTLFLVWYLLPILCSTRLLWCNKFIRKTRLWVFFSLQYFTLFESPCHCSYNARLVLHNQTSRYEMNGVLSGSATLCWFKNSLSLRVGRKLNQSPFFQFWGEPTAITTFKLHWLCKKNVRSFFGQSWAYNAKTAHCRD